MLEEYVINLFNINTTLQTDIRTDTIKLSLTNQLIPKQPKENYYGNREYKYKITNIDSLKKDKRATQCLFRLYEGNGKAIYFIGIDDDGNIKGLYLNDMLVSLRNIKTIVEIIDATIYKISIYSFEDIKYYAIIKIKKELYY